MRTVKDATTGAKFSNGDLRYFKGNEHVRTAMPWDIKGGGKITPAFVPAGTASRSALPPSVAGVGIADTAIRDSPLEKQCVKPRRILMCV